jgi:uncharacterized protein (TIGR00369 family)
MKIPPNSQVELQLEYLETHPGERMKCKLPFQERFTNPVGLYQGGFLAAGLDEVFGPLSYMTANGPCMTMAMNVTYLKPFSSEMDHCLIEAFILKQTKNFIFMRAEARSPQGDLLAHAETHVAKANS